MKKIAKKLLRRFEKSLPVDIQIRYDKNLEGEDVVVYICADIVGLPRKIVDFYTEAGLLLGKTYRKFPDAVKQVNENRRDFLRNFTEEINSNSPIEYRNISIGFFTEDNL